MVGVYIYIYVPNKVQGYVPSPYEQIPRLGYPPASREGLEFRAQGTGLKA